MEAGHLYTLQKKFPRQMRGADARVLNIGNAYIGKEAPLKKLLRRELGISASL